jgi:hypothetical protein
MAAGDLTDLASLKAWLDLPSGAGASDGLLSNLITAVSDFIAGYLDRGLLSASYVETYDGNGAPWMLLRQWPITAVQSIAFCSMTLTTIADPVAQSPGFLFDGRRLSMLGYCFPYAAPVVVAYTAGYASVPASVAQAALELAGEAFRRREHIGLSTKSLGGQESVGFLATDMNAAIKTMLAPYRNLVAG